MKIIKKILLNVIIPILILGVGFFLFKKMKAAKKAPKKVKIEKRIPSVKIEKFKKLNENIIIRETGIIYFPDEVNIIPRVSGNIVKLSPKLFIGGFVKKDELLAVIEQSDYKLNIETAEAEVLNRQTLLEKEEEEAKLAKIEWDIYKKTHPNATPSKLRLRIPQVNSAKANLKAAKANLKRAKLNLSRTYIKAPFDSKVKFKGVSKGQFVAPGNIIAKLQDIEKAYAKVYLKDEDIKFIDDVFNNKSDVEISFIQGGKIIKRKGKIISYATELDPRTKMLEVIIEIKHPYKDKSTPIISGTYITATIKGKKENGVFKLPEDAIFENHIYIYNNGFLKIKKIKYLKQEGKFVIIKGITENDKIIITPVVDVVDNMKIKLEE